MDEAIGDSAEKWLNNTLQVTRTRVLEHRWWDASGREHLVTVITEWDDCFVIAGATRSLAEWSAPQAVHTTGARDDRGNTYLLRSASSSLLASERILESSTFEPALAEDAGAVTLTNPDGADQTVIKFPAASPRPS